MPLTPPQGRVGRDTIEARDVLAGGRRMTAAEFAAVARDAPLMAVGKGQYAPLVQSRPVLRADGTPLVIGVR